MARLTYQYFNDDQLLRISNAIKENEKLTAGEIAVSIRERRSFFQKRKSLRELAEKEFLRLGIAKTRDKTGILLYILLEEKQFYILADQGINSRVPESTWNSMIETLQWYFRRGNYTKGVINCIEEVGKILSEHFPIKPDDTNEIPDRVIIR